MNSAASLLFACLIGFASAAVGSAADNSIPPGAESNEVWYPNRMTPKLTTPQWVGEEGVECVVVLAIDDLRDSGKYESYLRPILQRLKQIDGRAPVSIMTCMVKPDDPQLQSWLQEGLSLECHTADHPCPILGQSDLKKAKATYDKCVDLLASIPNNRPVAFRTPCCDSLNTVSPRLFSEIINKITPDGRFLQLDSSVFTVFTADDPDIPRSLLSDADGREKFRKYIPRHLARGKVVHDSFVNLIENYPYPYVVQQMCWEFPCMVPSDWSANHLQKPNNPDTVRDLKIALDITVLKQGVFNLVFHPHGWIQAEQVVELIDHAVATHGRKVKFLNFRECVERLNANLLKGRALRDQDGRDNRLRLPDLDGDGFADVAEIREKLGSSPITRRWQDSDKKWIDDASLKVSISAPKRMRGRREVDLNEDGYLDLVTSTRNEYSVRLYDPRRDAADPYITILDEKRDGSQPELELPLFDRDDGTDNGFFVNQRNLCWINEDTDGLPDLMIRIPFDRLLGDRLPDARSPDAAKKSMRVTAGYRIDLVAHEPLTMDPVAIDWGPDGRLWIAEMADYPRGIDDKGQPGGRIRYLEDVDGDGRYDKSTLFLDGVAFPNGVLAWKKGVLVSAAPDVFYAEDTDGDGRADVKKILFTGFAEGNQQHRANGFARGLDNWLYLANGDSGGTVRVVGPLRQRSESPKAGPATDEVKAVDIRSRDLRLRPDTGEIETVAGQAQFGRNRDDWGNWFGNNNSRPMWHYLLDDHYLRRNTSLIVPVLQKDVSITPGPAPVFPTSRTVARFNDFHAANRFTSACSAMVYRDEFIGQAEVDGVSQIFISEPVHNLVHREIMRPDGFSFTSQRPAIEEHSEFLTSSDNWFRPTQLKTGPDGALYVADMYRLVIEHPQWIPIEWQRKLDLRAGHDKGRIWRVTAIDTPARSVPRLDRMSTAELVATLADSNGWRRDMAQQLLIDRADPAAIPLLAAGALPRANTYVSQESSASNRSSVSSSRAQALGRLHSLCTLDGLMGLDASTGESDRVPSTHNSKSVAHQARDALLQVLMPALADPHPGVRRHAIRLCDSFPDSTTLWSPLARLVDDADPQVQLQFAYTLGELKHPQSGSALARLALRASGNPQLTAAVISSLNPGNLEQVLSEVMNRNPDQTELLQQLLSQATAMNQVPALLTLLHRVTESGEPSGNSDSIPVEQRILAGGFALWQYAAAEQFLLSLDRRFISFEQWLSGLGDDAKSISPRLRSLESSARRLAIDDTAPVVCRAAAVRILGRMTETQEDVLLLTELLGPQSPPELQSTALATLARLKSPKIAATLLASYRSFAPSLRVQTCNALLSRETWLEVLLQSLESRQLTPADLDAATRQRLVEHKNKAIAGRAGKMVAIEVNSDRARLVADYLPSARAGGDVQLGSQLFKKMCSQCHKLGDVGHSVGPDLASLTDKSADALVTAVLDPNRAVETKFLTFTVITKAGITHTGLLAAETAGSVTLRAAEGKEVMLLRSEIEEFQSSTKSLMPEGLERDLKPADAAALVAYIRSNVPIPAMKTFPGNRPRVITAAADGKFTLTPYEAEIYGPTIIIEDKYKNFGWWSSADDLATWTIHVPKAGLYEISWTYACEPTAAGSRVVIDAAGQTLSRRVESTGSWDDYQLQSIGQIELPAGDVRLTVKPASRPLPALADVKSLLLAPRK